ncbi:MAG: hypothetical protein AAF558_03615 [Verrucomicrobiota bacterium]
MSLSHADTASEKVSNALALQFNWFKTIHTVGGYSGPVVSFRSNSLRFTGPGNDWRLEGLIKGSIELFKKTQNFEWLDIIERDVTGFLSAQRNDGTFENSYFEWNPFEGGMPHEPAVLAVCLQANQVLEQYDRSITGLEEIVQRYLDDVLTERLWNKSMGFVRDWEISDFQYTNAASCAAMLELINVLAEINGDRRRYSYFADALAQTLVGLQIEGGYLDGAVVSSNRRGAGASPFLASRCLRALRLHANLVKSSSISEAADRLKTFLVRQALPEGGFKRMLWTWRPHSINPIVTGASAQVLTALLEDGFNDDPFYKLQENWLLSLQLPTGAFRNAIGHGQLTPNVDKSEWRDWIPSAGWQDKIFYFLALRGASSPSNEWASKEWETRTRVKGAWGEYIENPEEIKVLRKGVLFYHWKKRKRMASVCKLS